MTARAAPHLSARVAAREVAHRRALLVGTGALVTLTLAPIFVHPAAEWLTPAIDRLGSVGAVCLAALHLLLSPVHYWFHALLTVGVLYGVFDRGRAVRDVRRVLGSIEPAARAVSPGDAFWEAAHHAGIDPRRLTLVDGLPNPAFTIGWLRPRIYLAAELPERLSPAELTAVIAHEGAHAMRRDPLRFFALRFLSCTFFWLPVLRRLAEDFVADAEVRADDAATRGQPLVLANAILRLASWPRSVPAGWATASFHGGNLLDRRVRRLTGENTPVASRLTRRSLAAAAVASLLLWTSSAVVAHPLPDDLTQGHSRHCEHDGIAHLLCVGASMLSRSTACPHTVA